MQLAGFVSPDLSALLEFAALEKNLDIEKHTEGIKRTFAALPRLDHFGMDKLVAGKTEADAVTLDRLSIDLRDWNEIFAEATDVRLDGLTIPRELLQLEPEASDLMDGLGYKDVHDRNVAVRSLDARCRHRPGNLIDHRRRRGGHRALLHIDGPDDRTGSCAPPRRPARATTAEAALVAVLSDLNLERATLKVTDRSLLDRAFEVVAKRQGVTIGGAAYREQMRAALPFIISAVIPPELAKRLSPPLQGFMAGGQTLSADVCRRLRSGSWTCWLRPTTR